jgi:serine/threonine protein kinase
MNPNAFRSTSHPHAICHRDLKPKSIILNQFNEITIGDFGFARWMRQNIADASSDHLTSEAVRGFSMAGGRHLELWPAGGLPFNDPATRNLLAKVKSDLPPEIQSLILGCSWSTGSQLRGSNDPAMFGILRGLGFANDDELAKDFTSVGSLMPSLESYPWEENGQPSFATPAVDPPGGKIEQRPPAVQVDRSALRGDCNAARIADSEDAADVIVFC